MSDILLFSLICIIVIQIKENSKMKKGVQERNIQYITPIECAYGTIAGASQFL